MHGSRAVYLRFWGPGARNIAARGPAARNADFSVFDLAGWVAYDAVRFSLRRPSWSRNVDVTPFRPRAVRPSPSSSPSQPASGSTRRRKTTRRPRRGACSTMSDANAELVPVVRTGRRSDEGRAAAGHLQRHARPPRTVGAPAAQSDAAARRHSRYVEERLPEGAEHLIYVPFIADVEPGKLSSPVGRGLPARRRRG